MIPFPIPEPLHDEYRQAVNLMHEIDSRYESGQTSVDLLEVQLEAKLEIIDAALSELEEDHNPNEDLEPEPSEGRSIEKQFIQAYEEHLLYPHSFPVEHLQANLRGVLQNAQEEGPMSPAHLHSTNPADLVRLADELHHQYRSLITNRRQYP